MAAANSDSQSPAERWDIYTIAVQNLTDLGLKSKGPDDIYRYMVDQAAMIDAVTVVNNHLPRISPELKSRLQIALFQFFKQMDKFDDMWQPLVRHEQERVLISEQEEQRRLQQKRNQEAEDMLKDTDVPPESEPKQPIPRTKEEIWNACLSLQKQIKVLQDKVYGLEENYAQRR